MNLLKIKNIQKVCCTQNKIVGGCAGTGGIQMILRQVGRLHTYVIVVLSPYNKTIYHTIRHRVHIYSTRTTGLVCVRQLATGKQLNSLGLRSTVMSRSSRLGYRLSALASTKLYQILQKYLTHYSQMHSQRLAADYKNIYRLEWYRSARGAPLSVRRTHWPLLFCVLKLTDRTCPLSVYPLSAWMAIAASSYSRMFTNANPLFFFVSGSLITLIESMAP